MDYTKSMQTINIPTMSIDKGRMLEIDHIKSAVTLLVHFKYVLFYMKEHYFIDIDYKIDTLSPQLKTDLDRCLLLYNELLQSSKYLNFVHNRENNYQTKSPIYTTFKTDRLDFQAADPAHELNIELQNLYQSQYVTDNGVQVQVQRNLNTQFEQNQMDQNFRPLNEYNEYFQTTNQLAPTQVGNFQNNFQTTIFVPNQVAGTSAGVPAIQTQQQAQPPKQAAKPKRQTPASSSSTTTNQSPTTTNKQSTVTKKKKTIKKRKCNPDQWERNRMKANRNAGLEYVSMQKSKKLMPAKKMRPPCDKCAFNCPSKFDEERRKEIFARYYALPNITMKWNFIASCMNQVVPKYERVKSPERRKLNNAFYFKLNGIQIRVCKQFFKATLDISNQPINSAIAKSKGTGIVEGDLRGKRSKLAKNQNSTSESSATTKDNSTTTTTIAELAINTNVPNKTSKKSNVKTKSRMKTELVDS